MCGSLDGSASVWDGASGQVVASYTGHTGAAASPQGAEAMALCSPPPPLSPHTAAAVPGPVTFVAIVPCPVNSARRAGGGDAGGQAAHGPRAAVPLAPFKKFPGTRVAEPCTVTLHGSEEVVAPEGTNVVAGAGGDPRAWGDGVAAMLRRPEWFGGEHSPGGGGGGGEEEGALRGRVAALEAETEALRAELAAAKATRREQEVQEGQARAQEVLNASVQPPKAKRARRRQRRKS